MKKFPPLALFAAAFGLVEAALVVYLRMLYYPDGFSFPLEPIPPDILRMEMWREAATLVMLVTAGIAAGTTRWSRFAFFMFVFGVWDIFYYVWLKLFLDWPASFLTPDLLFLLPVIWTGPVLAPMIVALSLCVAGMSLVAMEERGLTVSARPADVALVVSGAAVILYTFMIDAPLVAGGQMPPPYRWGTFFIGEAIGVMALARTVKRGLDG